MRFSIVSYKRKYVYSSSINAAFFLPFEAILFQRGRLKTYKFVPEGMYSGILAKPLFRNVETQRKLRLIQRNFIYLGLILILKRCPSRNIYNVFMYISKRQVFTSEGLGN